MRYYSAHINIAGDRNNIAVKRRVSAPELMVLQAVHGPGNVYDIAPEPTTGRDNTPHNTVKDYLGRVYGRTRMGEGSDRRPALVAVFPGWPNVQLPTDAKAAGISEHLFTEEAQTPTKRGAKKADAEFME